MDGLRGGGGGLVCCCCAVLAVAVRIRLPELPTLSKLGNRSRITGVLALFVELFWKLLLLLLLLPLFGWFCWWLCWFCPAKTTNDPAPSECIPESES
jgi:hypothetical protein